MKSTQLRMILISENYNKTPDVLKWGSHIRNNGKCAILNGTHKKRWWQPTYCSRKHKFYCVDNPLGTGM